MNEAEELEFLSRVMAENRRNAEFRGITQKVVELISLIAAAAILVMMAYNGRIPDWWAIALVLAGTACVFFRLGRFVSGY